MARSKLFWQGEAFKQAGTEPCDSGTTLLTTSNDRVPCMYLIFIIFVPFLLFSPATPPFLSLFVKMYINLLEKNALRSNE